MTSSCTLKCSSTGSLATAKPRKQSFNTGFGSSSRRRPKLLPLFTGCLRKSNQAHLTETACSGQRVSASWKQKVSPGHSWHWKASAASSARPANGLCVFVEVGYVWGGAAFLLFFQAAFPPRVLCGARADDDPSSSCRPRVARRRAAASFPPRVARRPPRVRSGSAARSPRPRAAARGERISEKRV